MAGQWIEGQTNAALQYWLRHTTIPMMVGTLSGEIVWCNQALEELLGYTVAEMTDATRLTWHKLTASQEDLRADMAMAADVASGRRFDYHIQKEYITKIGRPVRVLIHVLRYPASGEFDYFMVSVLPLDRGYQQTLEELEFIRTDVVKLIELTMAPRPSFWTHLGVWAHKHPVWATAVALFLFVFVFGDRSLEIAKGIVELFSKNT